MAEDERNKRTVELSKIPLLARMDHRYFLDKNGKNKLLEGATRSQRKFIKSASKKLGLHYHKILLHLSQSGAGFPVDQMLRQMAREYTYRFAASGTYNQPASFNFFEPFCHTRLIQDATPYMALTKELDHLFYVSDFFDYLTSPDSDCFELSSLMELSENQTFHFSANGSITDISFLNAEGREFLVSGFSMIRRCTSLHWYLVGGEVFSEEEWQLKSSNQPEIDLGSIPPFKRAFFANMIAKNDSKGGSPLPLEGTKYARKTIISGEIDLYSKKHLARCHMSEHENMFNITSDDPQLFIANVDGDKRQLLISNMLNRIESAAVLWDLAEGFFQLPQYFSSRVAVEREVIAKAGKRIAKTRGREGVESRYKVVSAIEVINERMAAPILQVKIPYYEIETGGHWQRLSNKAVGRDQHGNEVLGKTWVVANSDWKEPEERSRTVYVKDCIATAKLKVAELQIAAEAVGSKVVIDASCPVRGELYVLRCAAMKDEIFKVGFTAASSEHRAKEISTATGVPLSLVVVKCWKHPNASALEAEVHMMLAPYRINDAREFFQIPFDVLSGIVETTIARVNRANSSPPLS